jgi:hypothetical protein
MALRVRVDYNTIEPDDPKTRVVIHTDASINPEIFERLRPGLPLVLYDSESMEVDAVAEFDEDMQRWCAIPDWRTRRDLPPLDE